MKPGKNDLSYILTKNLAPTFCTASKMDFILASQMAYHSSLHTKICHCVYKAHQKIIEEYLTKEMKEGQILGPFLLHTIPHIHINRFRVIPKRHQSGKWCLITDLSFPEGNSVNDIILAAACTLQYISVDQVALQAMQLGQGALLAKTDIKAACRIVPVAPYSSA